MSKATSEATSGKVKSEATSGKLAGLHQPSLLSCLIPNRTSHEEKSLFLVPRDHISEHVYGKICHVSK